MDKLELWADGFLQVGRHHQGEDGALSEQFGRSVSRSSSCLSRSGRVQLSELTDDLSPFLLKCRIDGIPKGATHLTWSYGAFLDAVNARKAYHHLKKDAHRRHQRPNPREKA